MLVVPLACAALGQEADQAGPAPIAFELDGAALARAVPEAKNREVFCLLAGDADRDGDPDLLVNWHVYAPPVLLWNEAGKFERRGRWSWPENAGVPLLDASRREELEARAKLGRAGIYAWHSDAKPYWFFAVTPEPGGAEPTLLVEVNRPILQVVGLSPSDYELRDERFLTVPLKSGLSTRPFFLATREAGNQLKARLEGGSLPFFVGPELVEVRGPLELWGRDPHGVAWLDVSGSRLPELVVTRGAIGGRLEAPLDPKHDAFYRTRAAGESELVQLPGNYARGRSAQWCDLEGDGVPELYLGNKDSRNALLRFAAEFTQARDDAASLGLDFRGADCCAWLDLDHDGDDDLVTLDAQVGLGVAINDGGRRFVSKDPGSFGLHLVPSAKPGGAQEAPEEPAEARAEDAPGTEEPDETVAEPGIEEHDLAALDLDSDGDLDLLVSGWGEERACLVFAAEAEGFVEATARFGLGGLAGTTDVVAADFDADGWLDLLCLGASVRLFRSGAGRMEEVALPAPWSALGARVGAALDADGDGRIDVALGGAGLTLARNRSRCRGELVWLDVERKGRVPIGALVLARYADGRVQAHRIGSSNRGHLSQGHAPLALATSSAHRLASVEVRFPGGERRTVPIDRPGSLTIRAE